MELKSFGCSFIWGSELSDQLHPTWPSRLTWPALLAQDMGIYYRCCAQGGIGNLQIANRVISQLDKGSDSIYVINWTYIDRYDYISSDWRTIRPDQQDPHCEYYYKNLHNEYTDKFTTLSMIKLCIGLLQERQIKFVMTYMDELMFDTKWHSSPAVRILQDSVRPYLQSFDGKNLLDYSRSNGHAVSDNNHPLDAAHQACFEYAKTNFLKDLQ